MTDIRTDRLTADLVAHRPAKTAAAMYSHFAALQ